MLYSQLPVITDTPVCTLRSLRSVALSVPDPAASRDFYHEVWGLSTVDEDGDRFWLRATGTDHHVLDLRRGDLNALGHISFAVGTPREVDDAARALDRIGVPMLRTPGLLDDAGGGYGLQLVDPEGRVVELSADTFAVSAQEPAGRRAVPRKIAHVVLNTTDIERTAAFYTQVLGMRISDWSERQMTFLRCNSDHHVIALNQAPWASLNHIAYEMPTIDHFMRGIGSLRSHGISPQWGPAGTAPATTRSRTSPTLPASCASTPPRLRRSTRMPGSAARGVELPNCLTSGERPVPPPRPSVQQWQEYRTPAPEPW